MKYSGKNNPKNIDVSADGRDIQKLAFKRIKALKSTESRS
jgi:hypothetical protein